MNQIANSYTALLLLVLLLLFVSTHAVADVVESSESYYVLSHTAESALSVEQVWKKLSVPAKWWHPDHTYSGDSNNLSLELHAGGRWLEEWDDNSVLHGTVLNVMHQKSIRLDAPFGPLQEKAVTVIWTIELEPIDDGTRIKFSETATGAAVSQLADLSKAVDYVKSEAIKRLVSDLPNN